MWGLWGKDRESHHSIYGLGAGRALVGKMKATVEVGFILGSLKCAVLNWKCKVALLGIQCKVCNVKCSMQNW